MTRQFGNNPPGGEPPQSPYPPPPQSPYRQPPPRRTQYHVPPPPLPQDAYRRRREGPGFASVALIATLSVVLLFLLVLCVLAAGYVSIAADLPPADALRAQSAGFVSTRIYDRDGRLLHEIVDPTGGRRILVPYEQISPHLINATVATEDERFWRHPGVDPIAFLRAVWYNVRERDIVSGFSSIPQQVARIVLLSPEERFEQSLSRKMREVVLASEISRRYTKREILEIYLNEINYGNLAYGIEAAADTYFGKKASELTLAEAALLAGLPQAPAYWDPYSDLEHAKRRQTVVLDLMVEAGYISQAEAEAAKIEELYLQPRQLDVEAPHFVIWIQQLLEQK
ncbi:MAG TPA: biosynthetic peptidoglycan transglycosylase, partial [Anaerolineae bacterium]|nr:biosynthetic peptidoglycan transglycosylase [Anaerolineae bacterium]